MNGVCFALILVLEINKSLSHKSMSLITIAASYHCTVKNSTGLSLENISSALCLLSILTSCISPRAIHPGISLFRGQTKCSNNFEKIYSARYEQNTLSFFHSTKRHYSVNPAISADTSNQGMLVLVAAAMLAVVLGSIHAFSVLLIPLEMLLDASRASVSATYSLALGALTL